MSVDYDVRGQQRVHFYTGEKAIMDYGLYFGQKWWFKVKCPNDGFVSYKHSAFRVV